VRDSPVCATPRTSKILIGRFTAGSLDIFEFLGGCSLPSFSLTHSLSDHRTTIFFTLINSSEMVNTGNDMTARIGMAARMARAASLAARSVGDPVQNAPLAQDEEIEPAPAVGVHISDEDRLWFHSDHGLDLMERVILEAQGKIPRQSYGQTGTQEEREAEVRRRDIILETRRSNHAQRQHAPGAQNAPAAPPLSSDPIAKVVDVITVRGERRERETAICGAPLQLLTTDDFKYLQGLVATGEVEGPKLINEEQQKFLASDEGLRVIAEGMITFPPPPEHNAYMRLGSNAFLARPPEEHEDLVRANEIRRSEILLHLLKAFYDRQ